MAWKPILCGGKAFDDMTWIERVDLQFQSPECDAAEVLGLIFPRWEKIKFAIRESYPVSELEAIV